MSRGRFARLVDPTDHVCERLAERFPDLCGPADVVVRAEVGAALAEGRIACRKPRLLVRYGRRPRAWPRASRFVWTPSLERVYLVRERREHGERRWLVVTVYTQLDEPPAEARGASELLVEGVAG